MPNITYKSCYYLFILLPTKGFAIFTCRYFKLSRNTTALSQSDCRNFSCSKEEIKYPCKNCELILLFQLGNVLGAIRHGVRRFLPIAHINN